MPSWFPGARYKRYAREWYPIVTGAVKSAYNKVERELVSLQGASTPIKISIIIYIGCWNGHPLCRCETNIET